jgi:short-subunit dehydrogenase
VITGAAGAIGAALSRAMRKAWPDAHLSLVDREQASLYAIAREQGGPGTVGPARGGERVALARRARSRIEEVHGGIDPGGPGAAGSRSAHQGTVSTHVADLAQLDTLPALIEAIESNGPIDALVNCAGIMRVQQVSSWKWDDASSLLAIDLLAPLRLMDLVVHAMAERKHGLVINISSMAGRVPLRGCAYYGAAKAGLAMASEIARAELADQGVQVLTVYPGPVKSALEAGARADYGGGGLFGRFAPTGDPAELATRIMQAILDNDPRVIYPRLYGVGWTAPNLSRWFALSYGPPPAN